MGQAEDYRKRAKELDKSMKSRSKKLRVPLVRKQKALRDMANNEDWLDGKKGSGIHPTRK